MAVGHERARAKLLSERDRLVIVALRVREPRSLVGRRDLTVEAKSVGLRASFGALATQRKVLALRATRASPSSPASRQASPT
jgi:hypothetical protein